MTVGVIDADLFCIIIIHVTPAASAVLIHAPKLFVSCILSNIRTTLSVFFLINCSNVFILLLKIFFILQIIF